MNTVLDWVVVASTVVAAVACILAVRASVQCVRIASGPPRPYGLIRRWLTGQPGDARYRRWYPGA